MRYQVPDSLHYPNLSRKGFPTKSWSTMTKGKTHTESEGHLFVADAIVEWEGEIPKSTTHTEAAFFFHRFVFCVIFNKATILLSFLHCANVLLFV